jgi:hypothetical protein
MTMMTTDQRLDAFLRDYDACAARAEAAFDLEDALVAGGPAESRPEAWAAIEREHARMTEILEAAAPLRPTSARGYILKANLATREPDTIAGLALLKALCADVIAAGDPLFA